LQQTHTLVTIVADNLASYMQKVHTLLEGKGQMQTLCKTL